MNTLIFSVLSFAAAVGFFCLGYVWGNRNELTWRIRWIELEHKLAREQKREPRKISEIENNNADWRETTGKEA